MKFTRREKIVLSISAALYVLFMLVEQKSIDRWEWLALLGIIAAAWFVNTDPERKAG